jgi:NitT/TauT family transport system permease protein
LASGIGLGYSIASSYNDFDNRSMYACLLFVLLLVALVLTAVNLVERSLQYQVGSSWSITAQADSKTTTLPRWVEALIGVTICLAVWQALFWYAGSEALASPVMTADKITALVQSPGFWVNAAETGRALGISLVISCLDGAVLGIWLGVSRLAGQVADPT